MIGPCRARLGPRTAVHIELFALNRVVLVPAGIGTQAPLRYSAGQITKARCYGELVTLAPTGVVLVRANTKPRLAQLFESWGEPLSDHELASFPAAPHTQVRVFIDGRRREGPPGDVPLTDHAEIVLEVGPYVPPHSSFTFPPEPGIS